MEAESKIQLATMQQLSEAVVMDDVWTGKMDPAARRKLQNRLNQRAYRKRKELETRQNHSHNYCSSGKLHENPDIRLQTISSHSKQTTTLASRPKSQPLIPYVTSGQRPLVFPLPVDHLLTLVQYNVLRAMISNMNAMRMPDMMPNECGGASIVAPMSIWCHDHVPWTMAPTALQLHTPHPVWIDIMPSSAVRDNLIIAVQGPSFDEDDFCVDVVGGLFEGFTDHGLNGIVVWNDPWSPSGWEVTEAFANKWGYLLKGARDMLEATNKWRAIRGDDPLVWEV